ncbi:helix-turn-helix domain-containing protein [Streptomyces sp. NBC_01511]|uniref:helix-turn-helix domain-containing protein n=1 Tax=Streptomyces sp. NBC_01511 TaxID=2903889 RepID=UPI00386AA630
MGEGVLRAVPGPGRGSGHGHGPGHGPGRDNKPDEPLMRDLVGAALRRARLRQGRTLRDVADRAQVSLPYLSEIERGRKEPSSEVLAAVCRALGLHLVDLVGALHSDLSTPWGAATPRRDAGRRDGRTMALAA